MSHPIENMLRTTMEQLKQIVDVNTVIGTPVAVGDAIILPVSRVSLGFLSGGGEYEGKNSSVQRCGRTLDETQLPYPFAGTSVAGLCMTPTAFLTLQGGHVTVVPATCDTTLDRLIDRVPQFLHEAERMVQALAARCSARADQSGKGGEDRQNDRKEQQDLQA
ncbi:MAG: spore germination protein GerW family protein [Candidatus Aphodomorpha sp.]